MPDMEGAAETPVEPPQVSLSDCEKGIETGPSTAASPASVHYDADPTPETPKFKSFDSVQDFASACINRRWVGFVATGSNVLSSAFFLAGSVCFGFPETLQAAACIFGSGCLISTIEKLILSVKLFMERDFVGFYAVQQCTVGNLVFIIVSFFVFLDIFLDLQLIMFFLGSWFFLSASILAQFQQRLWLGVLGPLYPNTPKFIPIGLFYTVGSLAFAVGSILLNFELYAEAGGHCYTAGSVILLIGAWSDSVVFWSTTRPERLKTLGSRFMSMSPVSSARRSMIIRGMTPRM